MKTPNDSVTIQHFLDTIESGTVKYLTEWEDNFISSIKQQFARSSKLSDKQFEILERIYAEKTA